MGGGAAALAMGRAPCIFGGMFLLAPKDTTPGGVPFGRLMASCTSALPFAKNISQPALVIAGSMDYVAPPELNAQLIFDALPKTTRKDYRLVDGGTHCQFSRDYGRPWSWCRSGELIAFALARQSERDCITPEQQHRAVVAALCPWIETLAASKALLSSSH